MSPRRARTLAGLLITVVVLVSWRLRFIERGVHPPTDLYLVYYPLYEATYGRVARGVVPLWNPYQLCGIPWVASLHGGVFYPDHVLYLLLPLNVALAVSHVAHLLLVGLATAAFARSVGLGWAAAMLASGLFTLRGFIPVSLGSPNILDAAAWIPVGALAVAELIRGRTAWAVALLAAATALSFLAGYPQPTVYALYTWATLLAALLVRERAGVRRWLAAGATFAAAIVLGVVAAAIQLAPTFELVRSGRHTDLPVEVYSLFGDLSPAMLILGGAIAGSPFTYGVAALALAMVALGSQRHRVLACWAVGFTVLTALFAFGPHGPLFPLYRTLPFLGMFRLPDRILVVTDFAFAIAAAIGLDAVLASRATGAPGRRPGLHAAALGALVGVVALAVLAGRGWAAPDWLTQTRAIALGTAALLVLRLGWTRARPAIVGAALVLLATIDISLGPWQHRIDYSTKDIDAWSTYEAVYRTVGERAGPDRVWFHGDMTILPQFAQKLATRYGLRAIDDYEPLNPGRHDEYMTFFMEGAPVANRFPWLFAGSITTLEPPPGVPPPATRRRLLDMVSLRFVVMPRDFVARRPEVSAFVRDAGLEPRPLAEPALALWENPHALPRSFVVYRTHPAPPTVELLATISRETFDPLAQSYVEGDPGFTAAADAPPRGRPARIVVDGERVVEIEAELERPGLVVLADGFYPGWHATVDGTPAPILPTNHLFRGVPAPAGTHRVRFEYRPLSVALGALGSLVGWLVIAVLAIRGRRTVEPARSEPLVDEHVVAAR